MLPFFGNKTFHDSSCTPPVTRKFDVLEHSQILVLNFVLLQDEMDIKKWIISICTEFTVCSWKTKFDDISGSKMEKKKDFFEMCIESNLDILSIVEVTSALKKCL